MRNRTNIHGVPYNFGIALPTKGLGAPYIRYQDTSATGSGVTKTMSFDSVETLQKAFIQVVNYVANEAGWEPIEKNEVMGSWKKFYEAKREVIEDYLEKYHTGAPRVSPDVKGTHNVPVGMNVTLNEKLQLVIWYKRLFENGVTCEVINPITSHDGLRDAYEETIRKVSKRMQIGEWLEQRMLRCYDAFEQMYGSIVENYFRGKITLRKPVHTDGTPIGLTVRSIKLKSGTVLTIRSTIRMADCCVSVQRSVYSSEGLYQAYEEAVTGLCEVIGFDEAYRLTQLAAFEKFCEKYEKTLRPFL